MALTCLPNTSLWNRLDHAPALAAEVTALLRANEDRHRLITLHDEEPLKAVNLSSLSGRLG